MTKGEVGALLLAAALIGWVHGCLIFGVRTIEKKVDDLKEQVDLLLKRSEKL